MPSCSNALAASLPPSRALTMFTSNFCRADAISSMELPVRLAASSSTCTKSKLVPSLEAVLANCSARPLKSASPLAIDVAAAPKAATPATARVNGLRIDVTDWPSAVNPVLKPPSKILFKPSPALTRPENLPAMLPIGPGNAAKMPESSLSFSVGFSSESDICWPESPSFTRSAAAALASTPPALADAASFSMYCRP